MIAFFVMLAAAAAGAPFGSVDLNIVPVEYQPTAPADLRVPISDSVRAATWDSLSAKPTAPVRVRLACIVWNVSGAPGACIPAYLLPQGQKTVDWIELRRHQADGSAAELQDVAARRIRASRLAAKPGRQKHMFVIRVFDEVVAPEDAREPFATGPAITLNDVGLSTPLDTSLVEHLYPTAAVRAGIIARVVITCKIEFTLRPLCRDPGAFQVDPSSANSLTPDIREELLFATYQLASTMKLEPKTHDGREVRGRNLRMAVTWKMPEP